MPIIQNFYSIIIIICIGFFFGRKKVISPEHSFIIERFLFLVAIPCLLFTTTSKTRIIDLINIKYISSYLISFLFISLSTYFFFRSKCSLPQVYIRILASGYVNTIFYGVPILTFFFHDARAAIVSNIIQTFINIYFYSLINIKLNNKFLFFNNIKSPIIFLPALGIIFSFFDFKIPNFILVVTETLSQTVTGLSLFSFGLNLSLSNINKELVYNEIDILFIVVSKIIIHPLISFVVSYYIFSLRGYWLFSMLILTSAPTAILIHIMSKQFNIDSYLVRNVVSYTSILCFLSLFFLFWLSKINP